MSYKSILKNYIFLVALCLFTVIFIIVNLDSVRNGDIYSGDLIKPILLTSIFSLLIYLFVTWDDDELTDTSSLQDYNNKNVELNNNLDMLGNDAFPIKKFSLGSVNTPPVMNNPQTNNPINITNSTVQIKSLPNTNINSMPQVPEPVNTQPVVSQPVSIPVDNKISGESKYFVVNPSSNQVKSNPLINLTNSKNSLQNFNNPNIFIPQKNTGKFGIKF